ncbi:MAG: hypothetical protein H6Q75_1082 [Firmicutes bacterium]|nr:hypothetical protein [Bacillota bacterium]
MAKEIAIFCDASGVNARLGEEGKLVVYHRWQGDWQVVREKEFFLDAQAGLRRMRLQIEEMLEFLGECRIFVAAAVTGVPYYELEKAGYNVWEYAGMPFDYLDEVWAREEQDAMEKRRSTGVVPVLATPTEKSPGHFTISLKEIQQKNAGVTSKQILLPFITRQKFRVLEVVCNHLPPWMEMQLDKQVYSYTTERISPNEIVVKINNLGYTD